MMNISNKDKIILRTLGEQYAEAASLDYHTKKRMEWKKLNRLEETKPLILIDQLPWNELNAEHELDFSCTHPFCRELEEYLRKTLYKWKHFPVDMVLPPYIPVAKIIHNTGFGVQIHEHTQITDKENDIVSHEYQDMLSTPEELNALHPAIVSYNKHDSLERKEAAEDIFSGILPVKLTGLCPEFRVWDELSMYRGITPILYDFMDNPDFIHETMKKFTAFQINLLHQLENLSLLEDDLQTIHCSGAFTDELPANPSGCGTDNAKNCWAYGMAQLFSSCSKAMHEEFEIYYAKEYYKHVGLVYYGCCEPLHDKIDIIRQIPNVRKISISPWANPDVAVENMARDYVLSRKPTPAFLAADTLDEDSVRKEILTTLEACKRTHTPCEFILKDISTVRHDPQRLTRWAEIASELINQYY